MEREKINEWIVRYNEGTLEGEELETFLRMLANDEELRKEVLVDKEINRMLDERDLLELRKAILNAKKRQDPGRTNWFLLAAVIVILLAVGGAILVRYIIPGRQEMKPAVTVIRKDSTGVKQVQTPSEEKKKDLQLAENFKPNPSLESLVGEATRADGITVEEPKPVSAVKKGSDVRFSWKADAGSKIEVQLFNNKGNKMAITAIKDPDGITIATRALRPGLYYWKILMNGELVTVGKLRVV